MKIAIIGAGVIGVSSAYYLRESGHEVTVLEKLKAPGLETSFANGGLLTPSMSDPWNSPGVIWQILKHIGRQDTPLLFRINALGSIGAWGVSFLGYSSKKHFFKNIQKNIALGSLSAKLMQELTDKASLCFDYNKTGTLKFFRNPKELMAASALADYMSQFGVAYEKLNAKQTIEKEPGLAPLGGEIAGGFFYPQDASGDAHQFTENLSTYLASQGVSIRYGSEALLKRQGKKVEVFVQGEKLCVDSVVVACGIYSEPLLRAIGLTLPLRPCKGYSLTLNCDNWECIPHVPVLDNAFHAVATPLGKRLRVAGTAEFAGFNKDLTQSRLQNLLHILAKIYPEGFAKTKQQEIQTWCGLRPMCVDGVPVIGQTSLDNLFVNTGHGHLGWTMCLGSGKILADLLSAKSADLSLEDFSLARF